MDDLKRLYRELDKTRDPNKIREIECEIENVLELIVEGVID